VLCLNSTASGLSAPPFPVIFVHGIAETALSWSGAFDFKESLVQQGWRFGGSPRFDPATLQVINVQPGDLYTMNFSDFGLQPYHSQYLSLDRQGYELSAIIQAVVKANTTTRVILVAHGMGGLAAREYLQGLARLSSSSPTTPYRSDVAQLITVGTPHLGWLLTTICQVLPLQACLYTHPFDLGGIAIAQMTPGSTALATLNDVATHPLPLDVDFVSLVALGGIGLAGDGDGLVTRVSQSFLATLPGLHHELHELTIPAKDDCGNDNALYPAFLEVHTCEPAAPRVFSAMLDAISQSPVTQPPITQPPITQPPITQPQIALTLNASEFVAGQNLRLSLTSQPGLQNGDLYLAAQLPDGTAYQYTGSSWQLVTDGGQVFSSHLQPFRPRTTLQTGTEVLADIVLPVLPTGSYAFFARLVKPGAAPLDDAGALSNMATAPWTFTSSSCTYALSATTVSFPVIGGTGSVGLTTGGGCSWTATSNAAWLTITGSASGTGNGVVRYSVATNASILPRIGVLTVQGQTLTVTEHGAFAFAAPALATTVSTVPRAPLVNVENAGDPAFQSLTLATRASRGTDTASP